MPEFYARLTGNWRNAKLVYVWAGGAWQKALEVYVWANGAWRLGWKLAVGFSSPGAAADGPTDPAQITFSWGVDGSALDCLVEIRTAGNSLLGTVDAGLGTAGISGDPNVQYRLQLYEPQGTQVANVLLTVVI